MRCRRETVVQLDCVEARARKLGRTFRPSETTDKCLGTMKEDSWPEVARRALPSCPETTSFAAVQKMGRRAPARTRAGREFASKIGQDDCRRSTTRTAGRWAAATHGVKEPLASREVGELLRWRHATPEVVQLKVVWARKLARSVYPQKDKDH